MKTNKSGAAAAIAALLFASPVTANVEDGVEVSHQEDALYCAERKLGTWFYCEKPKSRPKQPQASSALSAKSRLAAITSQLEEMKATAWTCNGFVPVTYLITPPWPRMRAG